MTYKIKISEEAELDLEEAYQWYESQVNQLGSELIRVVDQNLALIQQNPLAYPIIYNNVRRKLLPRFPYRLISKFSSAIRKPATRKCVLVGLGISTISPLCSS